MSILLHLLDKEAKSGNPIFLLHGKTGTILAGNQKANELFASQTGNFNLDKMFGKFVAMQMNEAVKRIANEIQVRISDIEATTEEKKVLQCNLDFSYATDTRESILMIVKIKEDYRPFFLDTLLKKSKRPTFFMELGEHLTIRNGNDLFYQAFACTRENIGVKYENHFDNFLSKDDREDYVSDIVQAISEKNSAIVDVPLRTARGETLYFYFSKSAVKFLCDRKKPYVYCQLVQQDETLKSVENPFDNPHPSSVF